MDTSILDLVIDRLQAHKGRWPSIAEEAGISLRTLEKIARRETANPRFSNVQTLYRWVLKEQARAVA